MHKKSKGLLVGFSLAIMSVIGFLFGFTNMEVPRIVYMAVWFLCLAVIDYISYDIAPER